MPCPFLPTAHFPLAQPAVRPCGPLSRYQLPLRCLLLLVLLLCTRTPHCQSSGLRQQRNVWYNGLQITGIAVDESTGDVFFSDAANNRVVHQTRDGTRGARVRRGRASSSPMQLAYYRGHSCTCPLCE